MGAEILLASYVAGIENELSLFKNNELITQEYRQFVHEWARASHVSGMLNGPTLEMERVIALNGSETVVDNDDGSALSAAIVCPKNRTITVVLKHQSIIDLPVPDASIELYEDPSFAPDKRVDVKITDENGRAVFTELTIGKSYYARAVDPELEAHNDALLSAYDELSRQQYDILAARWNEYRPQWRLNAVTASLSAAFSEGLFSSLTGLWSDIKLAWNIISSPAPYLRDIGDALTQAGEWVSGLTLPDFSGALEANKARARQLMALFNDEAALYLLTRATLLRLRMYPWGHLLTPLAEFAGEILSGLIFGALLTLVTGPGGPAFLAYKVVSMLTRYGPRAGQSVQRLWHALTEIMADMAGIMSGFLDRHGAINHQRQSNARLGLNHETDLGTSRHTEIGLKTREENSPATDPGGNPTKNTDACDTDGCPVSLINGEELLALTDFTLPDAVPFSVGRQYRTTAVEEASTLGFGWRHTLDHHITFTDSHILWRDHENVTLRLPLPDRATPASRNPLAGARAWCDKADDAFVLSAPSLKGWLMHVIREPDGTQGRVSGFSRQRRRWQIEYEGPLPVRLFNTAGLALHLRYRQHARGPRLSALVFENTRPDMTRGAVTVMRYDHDDEGRLCLARAPGQEAERYHYRDDHLFTCRELPGGAKFYWAWSGSGKTARAIRHWSSLPGLSREYIWQTGGRVTVRHEDGAEEHWRHDPDTARLLEQTGADGATTRYDYDTRGNLVSLTDPSGAVTRWHHNRDGQVTEECLPDGQRIRRYYSAGRCIEQVTWRADGLEKQRECWRYDADGCLLASTDAEGNTTRYRWSEEGGLVATEWADGSVETRQLNAAGLVIRQKDRTGKVMTFRYDLLCRPVWQGNPETGAGEQIHWDDAGNPERIIHEDGSERRWAWNGDGQLLTEQDESGHITRYTYHPGTALLSEILYPDNTRETYRYDLRTGQVTEIVDGNGQRWQLLYTRSGLLAEETRIDGIRLCREYDACGRLITLREYDLSGREERVRVTRLTRDVSGRVTEKTLPDGKKIRYAYDGFGRLASADDGGWPIAWQYDRRGLLMAEHQGPASTHYLRDSTGALTAMRLPDGRTLSWQRHHGLITHTSLDAQMLVRHDWRNGSERTRHSGAFRQHFARDARDRLIRQSVVMADDRTDRAREYTPDARSLISRITDTATGEWRFSHDERGRLTATAFTPRRADGILSWQESFTHDAAGNLTGPLTVAPGNRLTHAGDTRYEYDGYGNRILEVTGEEEQHYEWDTEHRLTGYRCRVRGQETVHYRYEYDALGRRILKEDLLTRTARRFFWQGERLLCECDAGRFWPGRLPDNPQLQEALRDATCRVWLYEDEDDFRPLLMLCGRETEPGVYHYVCDHLGTPLELRDVRGRVVWSAMLRSYGQVLHADTAGINQPLRFQGQYHDAESGLYYNRHRYYDPGVGRYLSPDPVGLAGGLNTYAYAPNPLSWIDPLGLSCKLTNQQFKNKLKRIKNQTAARGNRGITGIVSQDDAFKLGEAFVGPNYKKISGYGSDLLISDDVLRQYRGPSPKRGRNPLTDEPWSRTGTQVNFQTRTVPEGSWSSNVHLDTEALP
ncbi:DUF6531 domain-containing protein [Enterobacter mori]|uniref:RHS repeat-associated core domain-containing protein n=1 Tax=Enterobacter mori TaxID=539813 RepID=UPI0021B1428E|nr:RHS repeat-associated core domain-containing protein [Enterobacter mori]UWX93372.1 DUF6531 domain-containing protein [Enterobacter mori]